MAHILKYTDWEGGSGKYYCNDILDLGGLSSKWWIPARMLNMSLTDYILMLKDKFNANIVTYCEETDVLIYNWDKQNECHKFVLWLNAQARKANFII